MKFTNRETQYPGKRRLVKVHPNNDPIIGEPEIFVNIIKEEGTVSVEGTPIDAENLNKGNWRDDESLSFKQRSADLPFSSKAGETQIVTDTDGETWIIPPATSNGQNKAPIKVANSAGTAVRVNGIVQQDLNFTTDPQTQITAAKNTADTAKNTAVSAQGTANSKSTVNINGVKANIDFTSNPQAQINSKADQTALDTVSQNIDTHTGNMSNPHSVTKAQIGLGNIDNTSDANKPVSAAQQTALNGKIDKVTGTTSNEQFYRKDANGVQGMREASPSIVNGAVPIRQSNGHISVPALPSEATDAVSKQYIDNMSSGIRKWVKIYDIEDQNSNTNWNQKIGVMCTGVTTGAFVNQSHPTINEGDVFRVFMRDYRSSKTYAVNEIAFRYSNEAYTSVHHAEQDGASYILRTYFVRSGNKTVQVRQQISKIGSGITDTNWHDESDNRRIVRIEKEVPL